jgi:hypothetical protein
MSQELEIQKLAAVFEQLQGSELIACQIQPDAAYLLVAQLQLALRHPANRGPSANTIKNFAVELQRRIVERVPAAQEVLEKGWHPEFDMPTNSKEERPVQETHNCYTFYELNADGSQAEQRVLSFSRPQDWGDSQRWHYHYCKIELDRGGTHYISHCHVWREVERGAIEALQEIASALFMFLWPGSPKELCGKSHLDEDDFWDSAWGKMPPYFEGEEEFY